MYLHVRHTTNGQVAKGSAEPKEYSATSLGCGAGSRLTYSARQTPPSTADKFMATTPRLSAAR